MSDPSEAERAHARACFRAAARCYLKAGMVADACRSLEDAEEWAAAARLHEQEGRWHAAGECHATAEDWREAARCLRRAGSWEAVAIVLERAGDRDGAAWVLVRRLGHRARAEQMANGLEGWGPTLTRAVCRAGRRPTADRATGVAVIGQFVDALRAARAPAELAERAVWLAEVVERPDLALAVFTAARPTLDRRWSAWARRLFDRPARWPWDAVAPPDEPVTPESLPRSAVRPRMVWVPGGSFEMGDAADDADDEDLPVHAVHLSPFWMAATPVTQGQYAELMGANPSNFDGDDRRPVENVSWHDAVAFCNALSAREGLRPVYGTDGARDPAADGYRLPTEAEWEFACRAGTTGHFWCGDDEAALAEVAWFDANAGGTTHPVGLKPSNPWGFYDMHGNVLEWCGDWWAEGYPAEPQRDPLGPPTGVERVCRGGSYWVGARGSRSAYRGWSHPDGRGVGLGFRLARSAPRPAPES